MTHLDPTGPHHDQPDPAAQDVRTFADKAAEAIRNLNHLTVAAPALPAPEVYQILERLERLGYGLAQGIRQLGVGLQRSLDAYDVTQDDDTDPADAVDRCTFELLQAVADATDLGVRIGRGRAAIAGQNTSAEFPQSAPSTRTEP